MGLDTTHDCWHGAYSAFHRRRAALARMAGVPLMLREGYYKEPDPEALKWIAPRDGGPMCACFRMTFLESSAIFDNNTPLTYPAAWTFTNIDTCLILPSAVTKLETEIPASFNLGQNYLNPFNPVTMIKFALPKASFVKLKVYDILGREVADLVNDFKSAGTYIVDFDASALSSGVYFYRLETEKFTDVKKMVVLK